MRWTKRRNTSSQSLSRGCQRYYYALPSLGQMTRLSWCKHTCNYRQILIFCNVISPSKIIYLTYVLISSHSEPKLNSCWNPMSHWWHQTGKVCSQTTTVHQREVTHDTWACCSLHSDCTTSNASSYIHNGNSALTLLVRWQEGRPACKKLGVGLLVVMIWLELCTTYSSSCHHHLHHPLLQ